MKALPLEDARLAIRRLRNAAGATVAAGAALAFGIAAAVVTWSLLSAVLLKPLPVAEPDRLVQVDRPRPPAVVAQWVPGHSYPVFESIRDSGAFESVAAGGLHNILVVEHGDVPHARQVYFVNHDFFATLGISAVRGRTFTEDEDRRGVPVVAVLSDHYWRTVFNADPNVLGRTVTVSGTAATVVGVLPRGFRGLHLSEAPDLYLPLHIVADIDYQLFDTLDPLGQRYAWIHIVGRLRRGETPGTAAARINALDCMCERGLTQGEVAPLTLTNIDVAAVPELARAGTAHFANLLSITVGLLLGVGCLTAGMLLMLRTEARRGELAVRLALGATRRRLAFGLAVEAAILSGLGAVLAVPVTFWFLYGVRAFQLPGSIDVGRLDLALAIGPWVVITASAFAATCAIALLASLVGLGMADRPSLQRRALATPRVTRHAPRTAIVAGQVAITLVLVAGAGLFTRSLIEALRLNPAIQTDRIVQADINLGQYGYTRERAAAFVDELRERLRQNGVNESVSVTRFIRGAQAGVPVTFDGVQRELPSFLRHVAVDNDFFSTMGLPIVIGRSFARSDAAGSPQVAVVSESLGRFIAGGGNPLGRHVPRFSFGPASLPDVEVIGVVPDLITDVTATEPLIVYRPIAQLPPAVSASIYLRAAGAPRATMREAMATARALDPRVTLENVMTLDEQIARQMNPQRLGIYVLGALGGIALLLTALGTYVIAESMVVRRRRELAIRAAIGAGSAQLRLFVLRDTARRVGMGLVAGLVLAVLGARLIRSLLYRVQPLDPWVLATVATVIFGLALLVSLRPALEATRLDLTRSLREE